MAEPTQYAFDFKEVTTALIKAQGLHEGLWALNFEFTLTAGNLGPSPSEAKPGALLLINKLQISRQPDGVSDANVVNAAEVNPPGQP